MHVLLGLLGSIVTILFFLDRMGIDLGGLNPFYWFRRRAFAKKYGSDPIYSVEDPQHIASLLIIGAAKLGGDLTSEQREVTRQLFRDEFSMEEKEAAELFGSAAHLLAAPQLLGDQLEKLVARNKETFSAEQAGSLVGMMKKVIEAGGEPGESQKALVALAESELVPAPKRPGTWG